MTDTRWYELPRTYTHNALLHRLLHFTTAQIASSKNVYIIPFLLRQNSYVRRSAHSQLHMAKPKRARRKQTPAGRSKMNTVMSEFKHHKLHSGRGKGGKKGRIVTNPKQAIAIGISVARRAARK
jgi:hypothetical protein